MSSIACKSSSSHPIADNQGDHAPQVSFQQVSNSQVVDECTICFEDTKSKPELKWVAHPLVGPVATLGHFIHETCLKEWMAKNTNCPSCKGLASISASVAVKAPKGPVIFKRPPR